MGVLDLADNTWMPLLIVLVVLVASAGLFLSMRHHIGKVDVPDDHESPDDTADSRS